MLQVAGEPREIMQALQLRGTRSGLLGPRRRVADLGATPRLADGKQPTDPLFPGSLAGRRRRQWLHEETGRLCKKAGVPVICPHSLRGMMATIAVAAGELPEVVAQALGHTSSKMTLQHYIQTGVAQSAQLERGLAALPAPRPALPS